MKYNRNRWDSGLDGLFQQRNRPLSLESRESAAQGEHDAWRGNV